MISNKLCAPLALLVFASGAAAQSNVAYYRFEDGVAGNKVPVTLDADAPTGSPVLDSANGNHMKTFADFTSPTYSGEVPAGTLLSGASNAGSLRFTRGTDVYSLGSTGGGPDGTTLNDHAFTSGFTVEASVRFDSLDGWQTFVGKDRDGQVGGLFYLQKMNTDQGANANAFRISLTDASGTAREIVSTGTSATDSFSTFDQDVWYNVAAISDGSVLSLYVQNDSTKAYELQGTSAISGGLLGESMNWTLGRGWFNGPADAIDGSLDEVRISDGARRVDDLLFARPVPEPVPFVAFGVGALAVFRRRKA